MKQDISELKNLFNYIELNKYIDNYINNDKKNSFSFDRILNNKENILNNDISEYIDEYKINLNNINKLFEIKESLNLLNNYQ
jgi:hypothetical protein